MVDFEITSAESKVELSVESGFVRVGESNSFTVTSNIPGVISVVSENTDNVIITAGDGVSLEADTEVVVTYKGVGVANFGDASMFSFHATKVFNCIEGGGISYNDDNYEKQLNLLKNFGITGPETTEEIGMNAKMNEFQAAMGLCNLRHIDAEIDIHTPI